MYQSSSSLLYDAGWKLIMPNTPSRSRWLSPRMRSASKTWCPISQRIQRPRASLAVSIPLGGNFMWHVMGGEGHIEALLHDGPQIFIQRGHSYPNLEVHRRTRSTRWLEQLATLQPHVPMCTTYIAYICDVVESANSSYSPWESLPDISRILTILGLAIPSFCASIVLV
jgi:hypothetical protein